MSKRFALIGAAVAVVACLALPVRPASADRLVFMTGPAGGSWYPLGAAVKNLFEEEIPGLTVDIRPGAGLINIRGVTERKADLGWSFSTSTVDAINGRPPFEKSVEGLCNIAALYKNYAQLVSVDASIKTWADMKGKRFATLPRGNATEVAAQQLLKAVGLSYDDLALVNFASTTDQVNMAKDGQVDAIFSITAAPAGAYLDLANSRKSWFVPVTQAQFEVIKGENAGWEYVPIAANTYPNQPQDVPVAGFAMHMIANCDAMSEDMAYKLTAALAKRVRDLAPVNRSLADFTVEEMAVHVGIPHHAGAARYYKEVGAL
ncbi:MAG: TAXI family TRAP transporter solute-binding subunit [Alphaproteobacteria bacterium]